MKKPKKGKISYFVVLLCYNVCFCPVVDGDHAPHEVDRENEGNRQNDFAVHRNGKKDASESRHECVSSEGFVQARILSLDRGRFDCDNNRCGNVQSNSADYANPLDICDRGKAQIVSSKAVNDPRRGKDRPYRSGRGLLFPAGGRNPHQHLAYAGSGNAYRSFRPSSDRDAFSLVLFQQLASAIGIPAIPFNFSPFRFRTLVQMP